MDDLFSDLDAKYGGSRMTEVLPDDTDTEAVVAALAGAEKSRGHVGGILPQDPAQDPAQDPTDDRDESDNPPDVGLDQDDQALIDDITPVSTVYGTYHGPQLLPNNSTCGWCSTRQCGGCRVWMHSPGSDPKKLHNHKMPCKHACSDEKVAYLRSIFGAGWQPDTPVPDTPPFPVRRFLQERPAPSNVVRVNGAQEPDQSPKEVAVSDTQEDYTVMTEVKPETNAPDEAPVLEPVADPEPETDAPEATPEPAEAEAPAEEKKRAPRTELEADVKAVTDDFVTGALSLEEGEHLTPHRVAKAVGERRGGKAPSTGAVSAVFDRWEKYGFAVINEKPKAFTDYTDEGREKGLSAMKESFKAARKSEKSGDAAS